MKFKIQRVLALLFISGIVALISTGCSTVNTAHVHGDTLADLKLRSNVYDTIKSYEKDCYGESTGRGLAWYNNPTFCHIHFADTRVVEPKTSPQSPWKEVWVVKRDGVYALYKIQFYADGKGGTAFNITFPPELRDGPSLEWGQ